MYKEAQDNKYYKWGITSYAEHVNGANAGTDIDSIWYSVVVQTSINDLPILADLNITAQTGISTGHHEIEFVNEIEGEIETVNVFYDNGVSKFLIATPSVTEYVPEAYDYLFGCSTSLSTYMIYNN